MQHEKLFEILKYEWLGTDVIDGKFKKKKQNKDNYSKVQWQCWKTEIWTNLFIFKTMLEEMALCLYFHLRTFLCRSNLPRDLKDWEEPVKISGGNFVFNASGEKSV